MGEGMKAHRIVFAILLLATASPAWADDLSAAATAGAVQHLQKLNRMFPQTPAVAQGAPAIIRQYQTDTDENGIMGTYQPNGATVTPPNAFFRSLGTNGRSCFTCHEPQSGWALSAESAGDRFADDSADPLFRLIDGAVCPTADVSSPAATANAYKLVIAKGLIRIGLPMQPSKMQFQIDHVDDPYGCNTNPAIGLADPSHGFLSFYRRPLPSANLNALTSIMWDGREPSLFHQSVDATLGHAEASAEPTSSQQQQIVSFEGCTNALTKDACGSIPDGEGVIAAQAIDNEAGALTDNGAAGGPTALTTAIDNFSRLMNDPFAGGFNPVIFTLYDAWAKLTGTDDQTKARQKIARGQQVFNTVKFNITGVAGLNDERQQASIPGTCGTCHNTPNVGNNSSGVFMNIGVTAPDRHVPPILDTAPLPVFSVSCADGRSFEVTDLGRAMITGFCDDIGKTKVPVLRALPGRSPYFHNGAAGGIEDLVKFYDNRFQIGLTDQQKEDLAAFLESL
jgi:cytochrome c peroxidase